MEVKGQQRSNSELCSMATKLCQITDDDDDKNFIRIKGQLRCGKLFCGSNIWSEVPKKKLKIMMIFMEVTNCDKGSSTNRS